MHRSIRTIVKRLQEGEALVIVGLGDSLTFGWEVQRGFFDRFLDALRKRYPQSEIQGINAGIPGDTSEGGLARLPPLLERRPDLLIVQFGLNDAFVGLDLASFCRSLESIVSRALALSATVVLVTSCKCERSSDAVIVQPYYDAILRTGAALDVSVISLDQFWENSPEAHSGAALHNTDGVHPNDAGHALMARGLLTQFTDS
jgi:acyl-CoA thioesterase I